MNPTPPSLLQQLRLPNNQDSWNTFASIYTPYLYTCTRKHGVPPDLACDLVQAVFVILVKELPAFQYDGRPGSFRTYLSNIVRNNWINLRRRLLRQKPLTDEMQAALAIPDDIEFLIEAEYNQYVLNRACALAKQQISKETTWQAFQEHVIHRRPAEEVAAELGLTTAAVYKAKSRVCKLLRKILDGLMD